MNLRERQMLDCLKRLRQEFGALAVKAEFEAEGTRIDELHRLIEITRKADLKFALKIGGCEAIRDLIESKQLGVEYIIAPMVESTYALSKYIDAKNKIYSEIEQEETDFLFNIETISAFNQIENMSDLASANQNLNGIVFGRVDFLGSLSMLSNEVNSQTITNYCIETAKLCEKKNLDMVVGGGVSLDALNALKQIKSKKLTRFETRKVIFDGASVELNHIEKGLLKAVSFELLWLQNKREYYGFIMKEDDKRINMLESRWKVLLENNIN